VPSALEFNPPPLFSQFEHCDNLYFPTCKPIQIVFGRNIAENIWNKPTHVIFDTYSLPIASLRHKMTSIFLSIP